MKQKRAILYARVSTPRQAELYSLDYQLEQERSYAESMGFEVIKEIKDNQSGRKMERDGLTEARELLTKNEADALITWKLDRLHRNFVNTMLLRDEIKRLGKELHYAQSRSKSGETAKQRLPEDIFALLAEIEADDIAERTQSGKREKVETGGKWLGLNRPPFGYKKVGHGKDAEMVIDPETAPLIQQIFEWYLYGIDGTPMTTTDIAERLTMLRVPTPQDRIPSRQHLKIRGYGEWSRATVNLILREESYTGVFYQFKWQQIDGKMRRNPNRDDWRAVTIPRVIEQPLWEGVQEKLDAARQLSKRNSTAEYLVGRRMYCQCGYKMRSFSYTRKKKRSDGTVGEYFYSHYVCPGRYSKYDAARACAMPAQKVSVIDQKAWDWVKREIADPVQLNRKLQEMKQKQQEANQGKTERLSLLEEHREQSETALKQLAILYTKKNMPEHILDDMIQSENMKLGKIKQEIARAQQDIQTPLTDEMIDGFVAFSRTFEAKLATVEATYEGKRAVIDGLDVTATLVEKDGRMFLKMACLLKPEGEEIGLQTEATSSWNNKQSLNFHPIKIETEFPI